jgi:hypothetical protein
VENPIPSPVTHATPVFFDRGREKLVNASGLLRGFFCNGIQNQITQYEQPIAVVLDIPTSFDAVTISNLVF